MCQVAEEFEDDYQSAKLQRQLAAAKKKGLIVAPGEVSPEASLKNLAQSAKARRTVKLPETAEDAAELLCMKSKWVDVGPDLAAQWLERNVCNRPLRSATVAAYARQMTRGEWLPIPQGLAFDTAGNLLNGQHRLHAIVQSGATCRMMVTTGVPEKIAGKTVKPMDLMDTGAPRSVTDQLKVQHGISGGSVLAAIVRAILSFALPKRTTKLSVGEILFVRDLFAEEIDFVMEHRPKEHGLRQAGVLAAFAMAMSVGIASKTGFLMLISQAEGIHHEWPLAKLKAFLTHPDAILLTRTNDRALVPMVLHALWCQKLEKEMPDLITTGPGVKVARKALEPRIEAITKHFATGKDQA